jgi:hypothetical protein
MWNKPLRLLFVQLFLPIIVLGGNPFLEQWYPGIELDYGMGRSRSLQLDFNFYYVPNTSVGKGLAIGAGYDFNAQDKGFFTEASFDLIGISPALFYGVINQNIKYYPQLAHAVFYAPEIGFGFFCFQFSYQPHIGLLNTSAHYPIHRHQFHLKITLNPVKTFGSMIRTGSYIGSGLFK